MQEDTKKATLSTDKLSTRVMTYSDFSSQQSVEVVDNTGAYFAWTPFK